LVNLLANPRAIISVARFQLHNPGISIA